mmetsp:Transcript_106655/g.340342  ORF Transcript_106655/g.340342 Transcript_106655/m.340342 type:complete len:219 (-) Transcript_106655:828-1484(-)
MACQSRRALPRHNPKPSATHDLLLATTQSPLTRRGVPWSASTGCASASASCRRRASHAFLLPGSRPPPHLRGGWVLHRGSRSAVRRRARSPRPTTKRRAHWTNRPRRGQGQGEATVRSRFPAWPTRREHRPALPPRQTAAASSQPEPARHPWVLLRPPGPLHPHRRRPPPPRPRFPQPQPVPRMSCRRPSEPSLGPYASVSSWRRWPLPSRRPPQPRS